MYTEDRNWFGHIRLDSSPQFAKNYLLGEMDQVEILSPTTWSEAVLENLSPGYISELCSYLLLFLCCLFSF